MLAGDAAFPTITGNETGEVGQRLSGVPAV